MHLFETSGLAIKDWSHDLAISVCSVLALACIVTPLLLLHSVHQGVIKSLKERLLSDPTVLVIMPRGSTGSGFNEDFFNTVSEHKDVDFVIGRTRDVAAELQLTAADDKYLTVTIEPTAKGDPLFRRAGLEFTESRSDGYHPIYLTRLAASKLGIGLGDLVEGHLSRKKLSGKPESMVILFKLSGIIPDTVFSGNSAFLPLHMLLAIQDFRDDIKIPSLGISGSREPSAERFYESFRIYAKSLDGVEVLDNWLNRNGVLTVTRAKDISNLRKMNQALTTIVLLITTAVSIGFMAFMFSSVYASIQRKKKSLGMLRLLGLKKTDILCYSIIQSMLTALFGCLISFILYACLANVIDAFFASQTEGNGICYIPNEDFVFILIAVVLLAVISSLQPAFKSASIEPSKVIRDI